MSILSCNLLCWQEACMDNSWTEIDSRGTPCQRPTHHFTLTRRHCTRRYARLRLHRIAFHMTKWRNRQGKQPPTHSTSKVAKGRSTSLRGQKGPTRGLKKAGLKKRALGRTWFPSSRSSQDAIAPGHRTETVRCTGDGGPGDAVGTGCAIKT